MIIHENYHFVIVVNVVQTSVYFSCCSSVSVETDSITPTPLVSAGLTLTALILATGDAIIAVVGRELWRNLRGITPHLKYIKRMSSEYFLGGELDVCPFRKAYICLQTIFHSTYFMCSYKAPILLSFATVDQFAMTCVWYILCDILRLLRTRNHSVFAQNFFRPPYKHLQMSMLKKLVLLWNVCGMGGINPRILQY
jgi:hypothetical protein